MAHATVSRPGCYSTPVRHLSRFGSSLSVHMRQFIRHPAEIPIEVSVKEDLAVSMFHSYNVSVGGLAFRSQLALKSGAIVEVRIPFVRPPFSTTARIIWCSR